MTRTALVTGATGGIGRAVTRRLGADGWSVMLSDRTAHVEQVAAELASENVPGSYRARTCDVRSAAEVADLIAAAHDRDDRLDLVVVNAGTGGGSDQLVDLDEGELGAVLAVNLTGCFLTMRAAARVLLAQGSGSIVVISSLYAQRPVAGAAGYSASKAAVEAMTKTAALELAPHGVRVNAIAPGFVDTAMRWDALRSRAERDAVTPEELYQADVETVPLRRYGTGEDVAGSVAFLAGPDAGYITGHVIDLSGGLSLL
ncbi:SDR family NAD(P)-dependent oxidoreductase [Nocardioides sp. LHG3406-4]|uniref:SDR family NAD(P)-dependent oxidoreductase n=1 Tax=Nocardioides sp. LHG3406-4 TaxID=2804575 RepID=UPI003CF1C223